MCYRPIRIYNNRTFKRSGIDRDYLYVPCGHCAQCKQKNQDDWYVRLSYEYEYYKSIGGCSVFVTCTFNDYNVPKFDYKKVKILDSYHKYDLSYYDGNLCFGKSDVRQFVKDLRAILARNGLKDGLKIFCVSELGTDDRYTHRPHYHFIFFIPRQIDANKFLGYCNYAWSHKIKISDYPQFAVSADELKKQFDKGYYYINNHVVVKKSNGCAGVTYMLRNGFCSYSRNEDGSSRPFLYNTLGIRYLLKYLYKDDLFMSNSFARDVREILLSLPKLSVLTDDEVKAVRYLKDVLPFHLSSQNIGHSLVEQFNNSGDYSAIIQNKKISVNGDMNKYSVPTYIIKKICYNQEIEPSLIPYRDSARMSKISEIGYKVLLEQYNYKISEKLESYSYVLSPAFISKLHKLSHILYNEIDVVQLRDFLLKHNKMIAIYDIVYRGIFINITKDIYTFDIKQFIDLAKCFFDIKLYTQPVNSCISIEDIDDSQLSKFNLFNSFENSVSLFFDELPQFEGFNNFLDSVTKIRNLVYENEYKLKAAKYNKDLITRKVNSSIKYNN